MSRGCVLDLRFQDKQGSVVTDYSRYGNDGAVVGGVEWTEHGMKFDGNSGYLDCGNDESLDLNNGFTISAVLKTTNISLMIPVMWGEMAIQKRRSMMILNGELWFSGYTENINSWIRVNDGEFHHCVIALDENDYARTYVDGVAGNHSGLSLLAYNYNGSRIGANVNYTELFDGNIDQVQIYNYALPLHEIKSLYDARRHLYD